jgi:hypothetical protein
MTLENLTKIDVKEACKYSIFCISHFSSTVMISTDEDSLVLYSQGFKLDGIYRNLPPLPSYPSHLFPSLLPLPFHFLGSTLSPSPSLGFCLHRSRADLNSEDGKQEEDQLEW